MSNFIFHELSIQLIIELLPTFNRTIKPTTCFLSKILKLSMHIIYTISFITPLLWISVQLSNSDIHVHVVTAYNVTANLKKIV